MNTGCKEWAEDITAYVYDELSVRRAEGLLRHIAGCPECVRAERALRRVKLYLGLWPDIEPSEDMEKDLSVRMFMASPWRGLVSSRG